jgi:uncharacterized protein
VSIREHVLVLEELASIDKEVGRIDEELSKHKGSLDGMKGDLKDLKARIASDRDSLETMDKTRGELMIEIRQMTAQIEKSREKLQRSRNERESNAAQRELEEVRKLIRDREEEVEKLGNLCDQARLAIENADEKRGQIDKELSGSVEGTTRSIDELTTERETLAERRKDASKRLPPVLFRRYETIRHRRPVAIAQTTDGICNGCHIAVPPALFQQLLRQSEVLQCPNCLRILYYVSPSSDTVAAAESS